jgi:hypothetical protein
MLRSIRDACPEAQGESSMLICRSLDRALWVYGHLFPPAPTARSSSKPRIAEDKPSGPILASSGMKSEVLTGRIRSLSQTTSDGWLRREIIVRQDASGYPRIRDQIDLVDSSSTRYAGLPFIKGAGVQGYVCLGKPGALKRWFLQRFPAEHIPQENENVYFEPTGSPSEYRIYSASEWEARWSKASDAGQSEHR